MNGKVPIIRKGEFKFYLKPGIIAGVILGDLVFKNRCVGFIPKEYEFPDFKECFDNVIRILKEEELYPISKKEWENSYKS